MTPDQYFDWSPENTERLRVLWVATENGESISTAEIGRRLGTTKHSVIGKARRIGLKPRLSPFAYRAAYATKLGNRTNRRGLGCAVPIDWTPLHDHLVAMVEAGGMSRLAMADRLGVSSPALTRYANLKGIVLPRMKGGPAKGSKVTRTPEHQAKLNAAHEASGHYHRMRAARIAYGDPEAWRAAVSAGQKRSHERRRLARVAAQAEAAAHPVVVESSGPYRGIVAREGLSGTAGRPGVGIFAQAVRPLGLNEVRQ